MKEWGKEWEWKMKKLWKRVCSYKDKFWTTYFSGTISSKSCVTWLAMTSKFLVLWCTKCVFPMLVSEALGLQKAHQKGFLGYSFGLFWWCWFRNLECAPLKVLGSILSHINFGEVIWLIQIKIHGITNL